jgi:ABC-type transport system involved in multi-copper enzyme maturation permease subunit
VLTLVGRSFRRQAGIFFSVAGLLVAFQFALIAVAASYAERGDFERLAQITPAFIQKALGPSLRSFAGMSLIGYVEPVPVMLVVIFLVYLATEPAAEVEAGLVDLVLSRPVARQRLITRTLLLMAFAVVSLQAATGVAIWLGLLWLAPAGVAWPRPSDALTLMAYLTATAWCFGAIALAVAARSRRRASALAPAAIGAIAMYLLQMLGDVWSVAGKLAVLSPFHYFPGAAVLNGKTDLALNLTVLGTASVVFIALAYWQFSRRDL